jgi:RNA polymerase sigma-70 factor (ECF subfamily)
MAPSPHEINQLLKAWSAGDKLALDKLMPRVGDNLHRLAHRFTRRHMAAEREDHTLQTTALVDEAYLRRVAGLMRHILVDAAQSRRALQRGTDPRVVEFDEAAMASAGQAVEAVDLIALDGALSALAVVDARDGLAASWAETQTGQGGSA